MKTCTRIVFLALIPCMVCILNGCSSTPPVIPQTKPRPFTFNPINFLRTGLSIDLAASSSRVLVLATTHDGTWTAYDLPSLTRRSNGRLPGIRALAIHPDGGSFFALSDGGLVTLVSLADGRQAPIIAASLPAGRLPAAAISCDASRAIARPPWGQSRLFDLASASSAPLDLPGQDVRFLSIASDGTILFAPRGTGRAILRSLTGELTAIPVSGSVLSAAWHTTWAACGTLFWEIRVWPRANSEKVIVRTIDHTPVSALAFGETAGRVFLFAGSGRIGGGRIRVYELPECASELAALSPDCGEVIHLSVSGSTLTAVSADGMAALWAFHPGSQPNKTTQATNHKGTRTTPRSNNRPLAQPQ